jgi:sugar lactone lactonase YvrE
VSAGGRTEVDVELVVDAAAYVGEGPLWHPGEAVLYWLDVLESRVHRFDPASGADRVFQLDEMPGSLAVRASGGLVMATPRGFVAFDPDTEVRTLLAPVEQDDPKTRMNDGKVDPAGRFWAGTMGDGTEPIGSLYRLDADLSVQRMLSGVTISNGLGWSLDNRTMYYTDTITKTVDAFDFDLDSGSIENRRVFIDLTTADVGSPDGLAMDDEGCLWLATWGSGAVRRFAPDGSPLTVVDVPVTATSSCTFGGADLGDLYVTTATYELTAAQLEESPHAGGLFRCRPGARGMPIAEFVG